MTLLQVRNVSRHFGSLIAVDGVSLPSSRSNSGDHRPEWRGQDDFFNLISGFFPPTSGAILFDERILPVCRPTAGQSRHGAHVPDHRDFSRTHHRRQFAHRRGGRGRSEDENLAGDRATAARVEARVAELLEMGSLADKKDRTSGRCLTAISAPPNHDVPGVAPATSDAG